MKKIIFLLSLIPLILFSNSFTLFTGESTTIKILSKGNFKVSVIDVLGGVLPEDILIDELSFKDIATITYIAPIVPMDTYLKLKVDGKIIDYNFIVVEPSFPQDATFVTLEEFSGNVAISKDGQNWSPVSKKEKLYEGIILKTLDNSYAVISGNWGKLYVKPNSTVKILRSRSNNKDFDFIVEVEKGEVVADVLKFIMSKSRFQIKKDSVTAGVRGTRFGVKDNTWFVFEGTVYLFNGNRLISLGAKKLVKVIENTFENPQDFEEEFETYIDTFDKLFEDLEKEIDKQMEEWDIELPGI
ncbi:MAG TPA: hypothetical protein DER56_07510 [Thermosipho africanus]|nr:hypothetical protein [Thermosipho africanus]